MQSSSATGSSCIFSDSVDTAKSSSSSSSFIVRFPCYAHVGRFPPIPQSSSSNAFSPIPTLSLVQETCWTYSSHDFLLLPLSLLPSVCGFWSNVFYGRMPFLTPTLVYLPSLGPAQWCAGLHTTEVEVCKLR